MAHVKGKQRHDEMVAAYRLAQPCVSRCAHCRWRAEGTLEQTRAAYAQHRRDKHPDLPPPRSRIQLRAGAWQTGSKRIDDNVKAARQQGAGRRV